MNKFLTKDLFAQTTNVHLSIDQTELSNILVCHILENRNADPCLEFGA